MSASNAGPGRRPGKEPRTLELISRIKDYEREGRSLAEIAALEDCSVSYIKLLKRAPGEARPRKPPPLRLTERALAHHAVLAIRRDTRLRAFDPAKKLFWLDCVMEIHALGDDAGLAIGADGDPFETHHEFATALGGKADDLEHFLRRGLLKRLPDGGIDFPLRIGLRPKERARAALPGSGEQPLAQPFGSPCDDENEDAESLRTNKTIPPISLSESTVKYPQFHYPEDSEIPSISLSGSKLARAAFAAANALKKGESLSSSSSNGSRAGEDSEIRQFHCPPDSEKDSDINSQRTCLADLTQELAVLAKLSRPPNADDLGTVQGWADQGDTPDNMRDVIRIKRGQINGKAITALAYFNDAMADARKKRKGEAAAPTAAAALPAAPDEVEEAPIVGSDIAACWARVQRALGKGVSRNWLRNAKIAGPDEACELTIILPTRFIRDHVAKDYGTRLTALWQAEMPEIIRTNIEVAGGGLEPPEAAD
jgi:hypothetical protein